jgi:uncharacterized membrane protein YphA (DoxX/SURF4 family)
MPILILLSRVSLGWYVLNAGTEKVQRELAGGLGTFFLANNFQDYSVILPGFFAQILGYAWPWLETTFGLLLFVGLFGRVAAAVVAWLLLSIGIAMLFDGGLFPRHYLMVFVPAALLLFALEPSRYSLDALIRGKRR